MRKIKVNKEVFEALEEAKFWLGSENYKNWILQGYHKGSLSHDQFDGLERNLWKYEIHEVAEILFNGYEVDSTPEEKILEMYKEWESIARTLNNDSYEEGYARGYVNATEGVLNKLGKRIKGINY